MHQLGLQPETSFILGVLSTTTTVQPVEFVVVLKSTDSVVLDSQPWPSFGRSNSVPSEGTVTGCFPTSLYLVHHIRSYLNYDTGLEARAVYSNSLGSCLD